MIVTPILFSGPMVRALLAGTKMQTRRLAYHPTKRNVFGAPWPSSWLKLYDRWQAGERDVVIWVRETWTHLYDLNEMDKPVGEPKLYYAADRPQMMQYDADAEETVEVRWRPSIHMPRRASRLTLVVTDMRVQRLQDIGEADAEAEGCTWDSADGLPVWYVSGARLPHHKTARECFACLWDSINAARAPWSSNPEVVAVSFRPVLA